MKIYILMIILCMSLAAAQDVLKLEGNIAKNQTITMTEIKVASGRPTKYFIPGDYSLEIVDKEDKLIFETDINFNFMLMSDPPQMMDEAFFSYRIDFSKNMYKFRFKHLDEEIYSQKLELCNEDGTCDSYESSLSCSTDCPLDANDDVCIKAVDGYCDPDCSLDADPDCQKKSDFVRAICGDGRCEPGEDCPDDCVVSEPEPIKRSRLFLAIGFVIFIIILAVIIFIKKRPKPEQYMGTAQENISYGNEYQ